MFVDSLVSCCRKASSIGNLALSFLDTKARVWIIFLEIAGESGWGNVREKNTVLSFLLEDSRFLFCFVDSWNRSINTRDSKDKEETIFIHDTYKLIFYSCFYILSHACYPGRVTKKIRLCGEPGWDRY